MPAEAFHANGHAPPPVTLPAAFAEVAAERRAQDREYGGPAHDDENSPDYWVGVVTQFAGQAFACHRLGRPELYRARLIQVAAIAVAAVESFDRLSAADRAAVPTVSLPPVACPGGG